MNSDAVVDKQRPACDAQQTYKSCAGEHDTGSRAKGTHLATLLVASQSDSTDRVQPLQARFLFCTSQNFCRPAPPTSSSATPNNSRQGESVSAAAQSVLQARSAPQVSQPMGDALACSSTTFSLCLYPLVLVDLCLS